MRSRVGFPVGFSVRARLAGALLASAVVVAGCTVPSELPDGSVPQVAPVGLNGMIEEIAPGGAGPAGSTVWAADLPGHQLLRFDPDTGRIDERYGGLCDTDDVVVAPDGSLVATCPATGVVIRVPRGGGMQVLANVGSNVNPIVVDPSGTAVLVGFGTDDRHRLLRISLAGGPVEVVADGLPALNGFDFGPDGLLYVPTGGANALLGNKGGLATIDITTGELTPVPLHFDEPGRTGFGFAVGVDVAPDGTVYVAQGFTPAVYAVDPHTGAAELVGTAPFTTADNLVVLSDGRIVLSGFLGSGYATFTPDGAGGWSRRLGHVGA
jgi:sugar lactone lactonase YvrE